MTEVVVEEPTATETSTQPSVWKEEFTITEDTTKDYTFKFPCTTGKAYSVVVKTIMREVNPNDVGTE